MRLRLLGALLLLLSLGLKLHGNYAVPFDDRATGLGELAANFARAGFVTELETQQRARLTVQKGTCRMILRPLDPHASNRASIVATLQQEGRIGYVWRGSWRSDLPRFGPLIEYYFMREFARHGFATSRHPVWIAALGPGCMPAPDARITDVRMPLIPTR